MFKIGDFSRLSQVPISALRYYDEIGLLKPARIEPNGYRYYSASQFPRLSRLLALKDLGLSLEQIALLLNDELTPEQILGMLKLKQAELRQEIADGQNRLARVDAWLKEFQPEVLAMPESELVVKKVEAYTVASYRFVAPNIPAMVATFEELAGWVNSNKIGTPKPPLFIYYFEGFRTENLDVEVAWPVDGAIPEHERFRIHQLPAVEQMAELAYYGSYEHIGQGYARIGRLIEENGYQIVGPCREVYGEFHPEDPAKNVTFLQFPVSKA